MRRLAGADSLFVFNETGERHQHTLKIAIVDPDGADVSVTFDGLREQMREALPLLEPFRWRLARVPLDLALPYWYEVGGDDLDLDYHVQREVAAPPGGDRELADVIARIASVGLSRDHPLWQVWFVEGLAHGQVAYVTKVHHALADGMSSARLLLEIGAEDPDVTVMAEDTAGAGAGEPPPRRSEMLRRGLRDWLRMLVLLPALLVRTWRYSRALSRHRRTGAEGASRPFRGPSTRFDRPLTADREFAFATVSLDEIRTVARTQGTTVNDVVLAVVAGALRRYLARHGELPSRPLTAAVPVSVRTPEEERAWGNRIASWYVTLATDVADPIARLRTIAAGTKSARTELDATDPTLQHAWSEYQRLFRLATFGIPKLARPFVGAPSYNVIVSTVPGPKQPLHRHGARLSHMISMGPLVEGMGINFTGWSYAGEMTIAVMACRAHAPDLWDITDDLRASLDELVAAAPVSAPS